MKNGWEQKTGIAIATGGYTEEENTLRRRSVHLVGSGTASRDGVCKLCSVNLVPAEAGIEEDLQISRST